MASVTSAHFSKELLSPGQLQNRLNVLDRVMSLDGTETFAAFTLDPAFFDNYPNAVGVHHLIGMNLKEFAEYVEMSDENTNSIWREDNMRWAKVFEERMKFTKSSARRIAGA